MAKIAQGSARSDNGQDADFDAMVEAPSLSVIMPVYNAAEWMAPTLAQLRAAIEYASWPDVEIIVVDDGSTDGTGQRAVDQATPGLRVVTQPNGGRFAARAAGLAQARGDLVLFLDARVFAHRESLAFVRRQIELHPDRLVWNGHAVTASDANRCAGFWDGITFLAWRRYLRNPQTTSYSIEEYDWFPKGTTFFLAPREWLVEATDSFESSYADLSLASDDTLLIRPLAERDRINISPGFSCTYHPRTSLREFMKHTYHRGTVFVDGYYRPESRYYRPIQAVAALAPVGIYFAIRHPIKAIAAAVGASALLAGGARAAGVPRRDAASLGLLAPVFGSLYGAGIARGLLLRRRDSKN